MALEILNGSKLALQWVLTLRDHLHSFKLHKHNS
jgi:hypothetical protein